MVVAMLKVAVVCPAVIVTDGSVVAEVVPVTLSPILAVAGAALESVTVPVDGLPPSTVDGFRLSVAVIGVTVNGAVSGAPAPREAEMVAEIWVGVSRVATGKVAVVLPAVTFTVDCTVTPFAVLSLDRVTVTPPAGAALLIVTVPVALTPPGTEAGATVNDESAIGCGLTVNGAETIVWLNVVADPAN